MQGYHSLKYSILIKCMGTYRYFGIFTLTIYERTYGKNIRHFLILLTSPINLLNACLYARNSTKVICRTSVIHEKILFWALFFHTLKISGEVISDGVLSNGVMSNWVLSGWGFFMDSTYPYLALC